mmetsp:Transcript_14340/g.21787  ORF Transcript_14340/g.21787 Transcript_14340/m.21787 type:complete len:129 (-) Transcript_14340:278-664(-)
MKLLKKEIPGVHVEKNTQRARKGTFEVVCNGETLVSYVGMPRPFKKLVNGMTKEGMAELVETIAAKLKGIKKEDGKAEKKAEPKAKPKAKAKPAAKSTSKPKTAKATKRKAPARVGTRSSSRVRKRTK